MSGPIPVKYVTSADREGAEDGNKSAQRVVETKRVGPSPEGPRRWPSEAPLRYEKQTGIETKKKS